MEVDYRIYYHPNARYPLYTATDAQLLEVLGARRSATMRLLQRYALEEVARRYSKPSLDKRPLQEGSVLSLRGRTSFKVRELEGLLAPLGIRVHSRMLSRETTHVLMGHHLPALEPLKGKTLMSEQELQHFLDQNARPYLQQVPNPDWVTYLNNLLLSEREEDVQIALGLFEVAGFVPDTLFAIILAIKLADNSKLKKTLIPYVERYATPSMYHFFTLQHRLNTHQEGALASSIYNSAKSFPNHLQNFGLDLARLLYAHRKRGFLYLWRHTPIEQEIKQTLEDFREGLLLDLSDKGITFLPKAIGTLKNLQELRLNDNPQLKRLPSTLAHLDQLTTLDLSKTRIRDLRSLYRLQRLKILRLDYTGISIGSIQSIPNLEQLHLPYHMALVPSDQSLRRIKGAAIRQALSNLDVVFY